MFVGNFLLSRNLGRVHATKHTIYNIKKKGTKTRHSVSLVVGFFLYGFVLSVKTSSLSRNLGRDP